MESVNQEGPINLIILTDDFGGGTGNHLLQMTKRWGPLRQHAEIVSSAPRTARTASSVPVTRLPEEAVRIYPLMHMLRLRRIAGIVRERSPDIVHTYFFWSILFGRLLKLAGLIPTLIENREDEGFSWGPHEYFWLKVTNNVPDCVVCVSNAVRKAVMQKEGVDADRTAVIHNGVRIPDEVSEADVQALRDELDIPSEAPIVGMVANMNRAVKGVDRILEAMPLLLGKIPEARCVVVGGGHERDVFREKARQRGLAGRLLFPGYREDVDRFYGLMDVSVLTSRSEGLSITLLESMSHGLPVVATRVGGNPEVVVDGETGYLVPPSDMGCFVDRVATVLEDAELRQRMGRAGRNRVQSVFSINQSAKQYLKLYRTVRGGKSDN